LVTLKITNKAEDFGDIFAFQISQL